MRIQNRPHVIARIPRYGLCNCLLVWAKAYAFATKHQLPLAVHGWKALHLGPWLRGERVKRYYGDYFVDQRNTYQLCRSKFLQRMRPSAIRFEPEPDAKLEDGVSLFVFHSVPHRDDFFYGLRGHESAIRDGFFDMLRPWLQHDRKRLPPTEIAIHVRRGDYHHSGHRITPIEYYTENLERLRSVLGKDKKAIVFSDAHEDEIQPILSKPNVMRSPQQRDILDLIQMMSAEALITSLQSTFGYWAGFLSQAAIILHPDHQFGRIRAAEIGLFEGTGQHFISEVAPS